MPINTSINTNLVLLLQRKNLLEQLHDISILHPTGPEQD